MAQNKPVMSS